MRKMLVTLLCSFVPHFAAEPANLTFRRILAGAEIPAERPSVSPDGRYLAFFGEGDIFVRNLLSGDVHRVTDVGDGNRASGSPVWSPDGKHLAYSSASRKEIIAVNVDGSGKRMICKYTENAPWWLKAWSSEDRILAYTQSTQRGPGSLLWIGVNDGNVQRIPTRSVIADDVALSPDGRHIVFTARPVGADTNAPTAVHLIGSDGNSEAAISAGFADEHAVGWTPNSKHVLVLRRAALWAIPVLDGKENGSPTMVQRNLDKFLYGRPSIRTLGTTRSGALYYSVLASTSDIYTAEMDADTGKVISQPQPLPLPRAGFNVLPRWSPDSRRILYHWVQWQPPENFIYSMETGAEQRIGPDIFAAAPCWSVNGILIQGESGPSSAVPSYEGLKRVNGFISLDPKSGQSTSFPGAVDTVSCAADLIAYFTASGIRVRNLKTNLETEVHHFETRTVRTQPLISHNGRFVAFGLFSADADSSGLVVGSSTGGPLRKLVKIKSPVEFQHSFGIAWSPDDKYVYFLKRRDISSPYELWRVPASGGTEESASLKFDNLRDIDISPDGKRIAFSVGAIVQPEIWALENFMEESK